MPKVDVFDFFKKYPRLAAVLLTGLAIYSGSKAYRGAQIEGFLPGLTITEAQVEDNYTKEVRGRRGRTTEGCFVRASYEGAQLETRIDCDDREKYEVGTSVEVIKDGESFESLSFARGHFYIDLLLLLGEILGVVYYMRLGRGVA